MPTATAFKLDPADKARWVADLRSRKFQQGEAALYFYDEIGVDDENPTEQFCCLGVYGSGVCGFDKNSMVHESMLGSNFAEDMGIHDLPMYVQTVLACLNDGDAPTDNLASRYEDNRWKDLAAEADAFQMNLGLIDEDDSNYVTRGCTFAEIADFIEASL